jgi:hypothetical protein
LWISEPWIADFGEQKFSILEFNVDWRIQLSNASSPDEARAASRAGAMTIATRFAVITFDVRARRSPRFQRE